MTADTTTVIPFKCTKPACKDKEPFKNQAALNMHTMRVHTLAGRRGALWARKNQQPPTLEEKRAHARESNRRYRERQYAKGLSSTGKPYKNTQQPKGTMPTLWKESKKKKRIMIPYPDPFNTAQEPPEQQETPMNYCPGCGTDLRQYRR